MARVPASLLFAILVLAGCAAWPERPIPQPHVLVHRDGYPLTDQGKILDDAAFAKVLDALVATVDAHVRAARERDAVPQILVYAHGGLTGHVDGLRDIDRLVSPQPGPLRGTDYFPIFINWDSSIDDTVKDDLFEVRHGERNPFIVTGYLTSPFRIVARLLDSLTGGVSAVAYMIDNWWETRAEPPRENERLDDRAGRWYETAWTWPTKVVTWPVIAGYGKGAWDMMLRRIDQMFSFDIQGTRRKGAARALFDRIRDRTRVPGTWNVPSTGPQPVTLTLAGHSMGAIIVNRAVAEFADVQFDRIVYMAAADSIEDFRRSVVPYLRQHEATRFYSFSLASKDEGTEGRPSSRFPLLPDGSLLVWIDQFYEPGLTVDHRRIGRWRNLVHLWLDPADPPLCERIHLIKFPGEPGDPREHGEFNDDGQLQRMLAIAEEDDWRDRCPECLHKPPQMCSRP